ncbi:cytochrome C oxidase subunit IV family protein [Terasakiella sp.]|uniref:cytochrome C oxidase subunit IV family protein n=1 Tax=Terasakiella sp. TaxID=2034861 RepID=UPI003AA917EE
MTRLFIVWAVLVGLTVLSMISGQAGSDVPHLSVMALALLFGFSVLKAEGILRHFLDLRSSSPGWRGGFTAFLIGLAVVLFAMTAFKI